ncbi:hypothetical protein HGA92_04385 [Candidatus Gracilibacteria bacterium]|nr:hypothetical protein [Candidatus Gracilibacteria bacterium]NUJ98528.1 hypothetical protein [Candidatus Gracilibacteria bacterium]
MESNFKQNLIQKIKEGKEITPFLFLGDSKENIFIEVQDFARELCDIFGVDKNNIFYFANEEEEKIKIDKVKQFFTMAYQKSNFAFQVFIVQDIERMTRESANACLKLFEEPGVGNIIFLTSKSESGILDTILSRVSLVFLDSHISFLEKSFYYDLIDTFVKEGDRELISLTYKTPFEKEEAILFLSDLLLYIKNNGIQFEQFEEIEEDIVGIRKNNLLAKYIVDKYIIKLLSV